MCSAQLLSSHPVRSASCALASASSQLLCSIIDSFLALWPRSKGLSGTPFLIFLKACSQCAEACDISIEMDTGLARLVVTLTPPELIVL